jgi:hypothetical protein
LLQYLIPSRAHTRVVLFSLLAYAALSYPHRGIRFR